MASRLINVRLDEERVRKARALREHGVTLSDLVREAIDDRFEKVEALQEPRDVAAVMARIYARYPDPPNVRKRPYSVHDPKAARGAIVGRLRSKSR